MAGLSIQVLGEEVVLSKSIGEAGHGYRWRLINERWAAEGKEGIVCWVMMVDCFFLSHQVSVFVLY